MSRQNIKPHVSQRKPVFHLINKPNFLAGSGFDGNAGFIDINHPSTLDNTRLPVSNSNLADNDLSHTEDIKDYSPIFSLPNPFTVGLNINNNLPGLNESSLSGVETGSGESEGAAEEKKQSSAAEIYLSGYSNRLSASITSSPRDSQGKDEISKSKKKRTASLKKEELEYNKSLAKKLTANFVDYYLKQDFYHKLNLLKDPYKNLQIKSYLRDNLILNLIFIQKFKEFKFYDKNFHLNLNLLPTSLSEFFDVFKTQNTKEEINNYLNFVYLINNILINLEVTNLNSYLAVSEDHEFKDYFGHSSLPYITAINSKKKKKRAVNHSYAAQGVESPNYI